MKLTKWKKKLKIKMRKINDAEIRDVDMFSKNL